MTVNLRIDGLFFLQVYSGLTTLVKSTELKKAVYDMNMHYLELLNFLQEVASHPERLLEKQPSVFPSEKRLYPASKKKTKKQTH